jgi:hypothetical protein
VIGVITREVFSPETSVMKSIGRGVLDRPVEPGDDGLHDFAARQFNTRL